MRRADKIAQHGHVGAVGANAAGIHRQAEHFGLFKIDTGIVQFRKAETLRGQYAVQSSRIHGTGRTMTPPRTTSYLVELVPVAFLPGSHSVLLCCFTRLLPLLFPIATSIPNTSHLPRWMRQAPKRFTLRFAANTAQ